MDDHDLLIRIDARLTVLEGNQVEYTESIEKLETAYNRLLGAATLVGGILGIMGSGVI